MKQMSEKRAFNKLAKELKRERKNAKPAPHFSNTSNPVDFPVTKYVHIVQVHPVENGEPNLHKVKHEAEFPTKERADAFIEEHNAEITTLKAVYVGRVNDATGERE